MKARAIKELVGASTSVLVLGVVAREPSYGYDVVRRINEEAYGLFTWQEGTVYPVLHKLEKEGLIRSQWQEANSGRERKYYYITARGRAVLTEDAEQWRDFHALVKRLAGGVHG
jgi:PadR family transcriptional regulator, regulatory protein PadR